MDRITPDEDHAPTRKRKRLSTACTRCRHRKVRCDERLPACTNCWKVGAQCVTRDARQPHVEVERREAQSQMHTSSKTTLPVDTPRSTDSNMADIQSGSVNEPNQSIFNIPDSMRSTQHLPNTSTLFSGKLLALPRFMSGNCFFMLTQWLDLAFARLCLPERFSWQYRANKLRTDYRSIHDVASPQMIVLGRSEDNAATVDRFFRTVNLVFPVLDRQDPMFTEEHEMDQSTKTIKSGSVEVTRLLVLAAGMQISQTTSDMKLRALSFAFSKLPDLIQDESIYSIMALLLMALLFRGRDDTEMAWRMLANAIPKAQSLGLHQSRSWTDPSSYQQRLRLWWSLFIMDKVLCIELQQPPMIRDLFFDQDVPTELDDGSPGAHDRFECFRAIIALAKVQSIVCERLLACTQAEDSGGLTLEENIREKIRAGGELDQLLAEWIEGLSFDLRPSEYPSCDPSLMPAAAFLAIQYYQTLFLVHRNALIINHQKIIAESEAHFSTFNYRRRIRNGPALCSNIARSIVNVLNHVLESDGEGGSLLNSIYAPLISVYTLAIQILKNPTAGSAKTDLEIQARAIRIIAQQNQHGGSHNSSIPSVMDSLHSQVWSRVYGHVYHHHSHQEQRIIPTTEQSAVIAEEASPDVNPRRNGTAVADHVVHHDGDDEEELVGAAAGGAGPSSSSAWTGAVTNMDLFRENPDLSMLDWEAIALTLDLPSF